MLTSPIVCLESLKALPRTSQYPYSDGWKEGQGRDKGTESRDKTIQTLDSDLPDSFQSLSMS